MTSNEREELHLLTKHVFSGVLIDSANDVCVCVFSSAQEVAEPLQDLKEGMEQLEKNKTLRYILSTLLSMGNFLNGTNVSYDHRRFIPLRYDHQRLFSL